MINIQLNLPSKMILHAMQIGEEDKNLLFNIHFKKSPDLPCTYKKNIGLIQMWYIKLLYNRRDH